MHAAWDHLIVALLVVVVPIHGAWSYRRLVARVAAGVPGALAAEFRATILHEWTVVALVAIWWAVADRSFATLGLTLPAGWRSLGGLAVTGVVLALLGLQWRAIKRLSEAGLEPLRAQLAEVEALLPKTVGEQRLLRALAVTAGICEEFVYRGYLIWYGAVLVGPWLALLLTGVVFGVAHYYQGRAGVIKTGVVGIVAGILFVGSGSLLWPMVLHAAVDLQGAAVGAWLTQSAKAIEQRHPSPTG